MKNTLFSISVAFCLMSASAVRAAPAPFVLAENGQSRAVIVVDKALTNACRTAAFELAKYLGKVSGSSFLIADKPVPGFRTEKQVRDNAGALALGPLTAEQMRQIDIALDRA